MASKRFPKAGFRWLSRAAVLFAVGVGGTLAYLTWQQRSTPPIAVRSIVAEQGSVEESISASGVVQLANQQTLRSPAEGAVDQALVLPGERVTAGQVLVVLRNAERETATSSQQLQIEQQSVILERAQARIAESEEQLAAYGGDLERFSGLEEAGAIPYNDIRDIEDNIRRTETALQDARSEAEGAQLELARLRTENRRIEQEMAETIITAPISGQVLEVMVNDGDGVELRTELLTLGDPSQELVALELSTLDAARISLSQAARVSVIGPNPEIFDGQVVQISPLARPPGEDGGRQSQEAQVTVPTLVQLSEPTRFLIPGSQVSVEIVLEAEQNVTVLGTEAVQRGSGEPFVWVLDKEQQVQRRPIQIGLEGLTQVEIEAGLEPGETVVVPPPDEAIAPGTAVVVDASA
ncbi:MAG: efflux RND transporter periplasmic adaptor subunit [Elainellaceae cyanobacterium]